MLVLLFSPVPFRFMLLLLLLLMPPPLLPALIKIVARIIVGARTMAYAGLLPVVWVHTPA